MFILPLLPAGTAHCVPSVRLALPSAPGAWLFSVAALTEEFSSCSLCSWQWRNQVPGGLRHDESACSGSKLANLHPVEKIQAPPQLPVNNGSGPFHCPESRSLHFTSGFAFDCSGHQW